MAQKKPLATGDCCKCGFWKVWDSRISGKVIPGGYGKCTRPESHCNPAKPRSYKILGCPECGADMVLKQSKFGLFYGCVNYPACTCTHGAHPDGSPKGIPGDKETRSLWIKVHQLFDQFWKSGELTRRQAYKNLAKLMDLSVRKTHIGRFTKEECLDAIKKLQD